MKPRLNSFAIQAELFSLLIGFLYFALVALPALRGESGVAPFVGDSFRFHAFAEAETIAVPALATLIAERELTTASIFGLFGVSVEGKIARYLAGESYEYLIFALHSVLLIMPINNFRNVFSVYGAGHFAPFLVLFLVNPAVYPTLASLNKEIWGFFFINSFLKNLLLRNYVRYGFVSALSFLFRDAYFYVALLFLMITRLPFKRHVAWQAK